MAPAEQFCTFYLDGLLFGVEVCRVQEVIRAQEMTRVPLAPPVVEGLINLRGQIVTTIDLRRRLELQPRPSGEPPMNIVVRTDDGPVSFLIDRVGDVLEVPRGRCEPPPETIQGIARELIREVCKLDGQVLLLLDTDKAADVHADTGMYGRAVH